MPPRPDLRGLLPRQRREFGEETLCYGPGDGDAMMLVECSCATCERETKMYLIMSGEDSTAANVDQDKQGTHTYAITYGITVCSGNSVEFNFFKDEACSIEEDKATFTNVSSRSSTPRSASPTERRAGSG